MRYVLAFLVFLAAPALAQTGDAAMPADKAYCGAFIPSAALKDTHRGTAEIAFRVLADGEVADVAVKKSSGYAELDSAAQACVATWHYNPAPAVESKLTEKVAVYTPKLHICEMNSAAWDKVRPLKGVTRLGFDIDETGHTKDPVIKQSSGAPELDDASRACIKLWRYRPAVKDDKPVIVPWEADIAWNIDSRPERATDMTKCVRDIKLKPEDMAAVQNPSAISYTVIGGIVFDLRLDKSSGNKRLDNLALRCASRNRYRETVVIGASPGFVSSETINWKAEMRPVP